LEKSEKLPKMEKLEKLEKLEKHHEKIHDKHEKHEKHDHHHHHHPYGGHYGSYGNPYGHYEAYDKYDKYDKHEKHKQVSIHEQKVLYKADSAHVKHVLDIRSKIAPICGNYMHRHVTVETVDGHKYSGIIVHVDESCLYLQCAWFDARGFVPYNAILPLVLFELLVIALM